MSSTDSTPPPPGGDLLAVFLSRLSSYYALLALASVLILGGLQHVSRVNVGQQEPRLVKPRIPIVGHIVGMLRKGGDYYAEIFEKSRRELSAATISVFGHKIYVIFSPTLAQAALCNRDLSFDRFIEFGSDALVNLSPQARSMVKDGTLIRGYSSSLPAATASNHMRDMANTGLRSLSGELEKLEKQIDASGGQGVKIQSLSSYVRTLMALITTDALYGSNTNPMRADPTLTDDIWTFAESMPYLAPNTVPWLLAPKGNVARARIQKAFIEYYRQYQEESSFPEDVSEHTRARARLLRGLGFDDEDTGRIEITMIFASTVNSTPLTFWLLANVFARPAVLERLRAELMSVVEMEPLQDSRSDDTVQEKRPSRQATLRSSVLVDEDRCPYLAAVYRENLRVSNTITGTRNVLRDTTLPDGTVLRAGATVHIPSVVAHRSPEAWGPVDPAEFEPARWFRDDGKAGLIKPVAYFPFGGGKHLCPGRNFALAEIAGLLAALALGFELDGMTRDTLPLCVVANLMGESVPTPKQAVEVRARRREGWEGVRWRLLW